MQAVGQVNGMVVQVHSECTEAAQQAVWCMVQVVGLAAVVVGR